jgi:DNA-binding XRE family transcriptional regulator
MAKKLSTKRIKEIRARFQHEKPTSEQLIASGDMEPPVSQAAFLAAWQAVDTLKKARLDAGLSLSQVAARGGLDKGTLSRLEAGQHLNPTLDTLSRYALALGRGLALSFPLLEQTPLRRKKVSGTNFTDRN